MPISKYSNNKKILIIDDNQDVTKSLALQLKETSFFILQAHSGEEALETVRGDSFIKVCIVDVNMPKMNGLQFLIELKKMRKNVEVILMSGIKEKKIITKGLEIGAKYYLLKPIKKEELLNSVKGCLNKLPVNIEEPVIINQIPLDIAFTLTQLCEEEVVFRCRVPFKKGGKIKIASPQIERKYEVIFNISANVTECAEIGGNEYCIIGKITSPIEFVTPLVNLLRDKQRKAA